MPETENAPVFRGFQCISAANAVEDLREGRARFGIAKRWQHLAAGVNPQTAGPQPATEPRSGGSTG